MRRAITGYMQAVALNSPGQMQRANYIYNCFRETAIYNGMPMITFGAADTTLEL